MKERTIVLVESETQVRRAITAAPQDAIFISKFPESTKSLRERGIEPRLAEDYLSFEEVNRLWLPAFRLARRFCWAADECLRGSEFETRLGDHRMFEFAISHWRQVLSQPVFNYTLFKKIFEKERPTTVIIPETHRDDLSRTHLFRFFFESPLCLVIEQLSSSWKFKVERYSWEDSRERALTVPGRPLLLLFLKSAKGILRVALKLIGSLMKGKGCRKGIVLVNSYGAGIVVKELERRGWNFLNFEPLFTFLQKYFFEIPVAHPELDIEQVVSNSELQKTLRWKELDIQPMIKGRIETFLLQQVSKISRMYGVADKILNIFKPDIVFSGPCPTNLPRAMVYLCAKNRGVTRVHLQHGGTYGAKFNPKHRTSEYGHPLAQNILVWSDVVVRRGSRMKAPHVNLHVTGSIVMERLKQSGSRSNGEGDIEKPRIIAVTNSSNEQFGLRNVSYPYRSEFPHFNFELQKSLLEFFGRFTGDSDFILKADPKEGFLNLLKESCPEGVTVDQSTPFSRWLERRLDLVIIPDPCATAITESVAAGKNIFLLYIRGMTHIYDDVFELLDKRVYTFYDTESLFKALEEYIHNPEKYPLKADTSYLDKYVFNGIASPKVRAADVIETITTDKLRR